VGQGLTYTCVNNERRKILIKKLKGKIMSTLVKGIDIELLSKQFDPTKDDMWDSFDIQSILIADNHVVQQFDFKVRVLLRCIGKLPIQLTGELALLVRDWVGLSTTLVTVSDSIVDLTLSELLSKIVGFLSMHVDFDEVVIFDAIRNEVETWTSK
jgi:UDP-glucose 6-dehydrogenase